MKKAEFMEFIDGADKEKLVQYMMDNNDGSIEVLETSEFVQAYADEPSSLARFIRDAELNLDCEFVRLGTYYADAQEADALEDLFSDSEVKDYFSDLADTLDDELGELDGALIEMGV